MSKILVSSLPSDRRLARVDDLFCANLLFGNHQPEIVTTGLRELPSGVGSRSAAVAATLAAAEQDPEFRALVAEADAARDARDFVRGEYLYWRCLQLYPLHHGYVTQYGHCLKEQGKTAEAEAMYRSALALGAPLGDVDEHIAFAAAMRGEPHVRHEPVPPAASPADEAATLEDVFLLHALFLHGPPGMDRALALLRASATRRGIMLHIVGGEDFLRANGALLTLLCERG